MTVTVSSGPQNGAVLQERLQSYQQRANSIFMQQGPLGWTMGAWLVLALGLLVLFLLLAYVTK